MRKLLLNKDDFTYWVDLSQNIEEKQLNPHILDAQMRVLKGTMCTSLYNEVYSQFLEETLTIDNEILLEDYAKPLLVFASYVNYLTTAGKRSTATGMVKVIGDNTEQITREELKDLISENKEKRAYYQNALSEFLDNNKDVYPLFKDCCKTQKAGINITGIGGRKHHYKYDKYDKYDKHYKDNCCD